MENQQNLTLTSISRLSISFRQYLQLQSTGDTISKKRPLIVGKVSRISLICSLRKVRYGELRHNFLKNEAKTQRIKNLAKKFTKMIEFQYLLNPG
jgi:hypothetical protein